MGLSKTSSSYLRFLLVVFYVVSLSSAIQFRGHPDQFAAYESWDACSQARMSFDFRTRDQNALLVYTDDGKADYLMLTINDRQVTLQMRVAAKSDQSGTAIAPQELTIVHPASVSNNAWHRLEISRNRLEVSLRVGGHSVSRTLQAADLRFGSGSTPVYVGGLPRDTRTQATTRAQQRHLTGDILNLLFFAGCGDCNWRRAKLKTSNALNDTATELCDRQPDICRNVRYLCKTKIGASSTDDFQCVPRSETCGDNKATHYHLAMDSIEHESIVNIGGLDTRVYGAPSLQPGVLRRSLELDCSKQTLVISGASHRQECFGDLSKCDKGYSLALWIWFKDTVGSDGVYLTNGGHTAVSHGVALELVQHSLQFTFRSPSGEVWKSQFRGVRPERWYHVAAVWDTRQLTMYVDGKSVSDAARRSYQPGDGAQRERDTTSLRYKHFYIGRNIEYHIGGSGAPPEGHPSEPKGLIRVDELNFWAETRASDQIREMAISRFRVPLDRFTSGNNVLDSPDVRASLVGSPSGQLSASFSTDAKFGMSLSLPANSKQYISLQQTGDAMACFTRLNSSVDACPYGIMASFWVQLNSKESAQIPLLLSGPFGLQVWLVGQRLKATANVQLANSPNSFEAYQVYTTSDMPLGHWCLVEVSFRKRDEKSQILSIIVNNGEITASISDRSIEQVDKLSGQLEPHAYLAGGPQASQSLNGLLDEVILWTGSRETLLSIGYIQRKRPQHYDVSFDEVERDGSRGGGSAPLRIPHEQLAIGMVPGNDAELPIIKGRSRNAVRLRGQGALVDLGLHKTKCLGNLDYCHHGALVALWIRVPDAKQPVSTPSCYLDTGLNGIRLIRDQNKLRAEAATSTHLWSADLDRKYFAENGDAPGLASGWHFVELTWHLDRGLRVFVDNQLVAKVPEANTTRQVGQIDSQRSSESLHRFYVGRCSTVASERGALVDMDVDELEYWYADREWLVAFDYILRGLPPFYVLDMDYTQRNGELRLVHPTLHVNLYGNPTHSPAGKVDWSIRLNGDKQWMEAVSSKRSCLGNLTLCRHGVFLSMLINFDNEIDFDKPRYLLSTGPNDGIQFFQRDQKLYVIFNQRSGRSDLATVGAVGGKGGSTGSSTAYKWEVEIPRDLIRRDRWYFFEFSWHPEKGLDVFLNRKLIDHADKTESNKPGIDTDAKFLIGQQNVGDSPGVLFDFAKANFDEMEIWFATRDYLLAHEYIIRDEFEWLSFPMEYYKDSQKTTIEHPMYDTFVFRSAELRQGYIQQSLYLDGQGAYAQIPIEANRCAVSVMRCRYGLMATFYLKPIELKNGTTFLATRDYQLTYEGGKLVGRLRRPLQAGDEIWTVSTSDLHTGHWNLIDFSWHPLRGLSLHINNTEKDFVAEANKERQSTTSVQQWSSSAASQSQGGVFIGRDLVDAGGKAYANAYFDEVQFWHAPRETLLTFDLIFRGPVEKEVFPFQEVTNDLVKHDRIYVYTLGGPKIVTRPDGQTALNLDGTLQGVRVGDNITCQHLDGCVNGYTIRMLIRPTRLYDGMYLLSSDTAEIFYRNGKIVAKMRSTNEEWTVEGQGLRLNSWNWVDVSWYNETGLTLYINGRKVERSFRSKPFDPKVTNEYSFYIGRPEQSRGSWAKHAEMDVARVELWKARYEMIIHEKGINLDLPREKLMAPLQPDGRWFVEYDLRQAPPSYKRVNTRDEFELRFQTSSPDGWLVQHMTPATKGDTAGRRQGLWIGLEKGHLLVIGGPDKTRPTFSFRSPRPVNDNAVHYLKMVVQRPDDGGESAKMTLILDSDTLTEEHALPSAFHLISDLLYYLGGAPDTEWRSETTIRENFRGFINEATIRGDRQPQILDLLELFYKHPRDPWVNVIRYDPPTPPPYEAVPSVTFLRPTGGIVVDEDWPLGTQAAGANNIQLTFSTLERESLLLYTEPNNKTNGNGQPGGITSLVQNKKESHFMTLEIFDGHLYFVWSGIGAKRLLLCANISDGQQHIATISLQHTRVSTSCDNNKEMVVSVQAPFLRQSGDWRVTLGGAIDYNTLPWLLYTHRAAARGFVGCILSLTIDTQPTDFRTLIKQHGSSVVEGCRDQKSSCSHRLCGSGRCFDSWNAPAQIDDSTKKYICDCSATAFTGASCSEPAPIYTFNGTSSVSLAFKPPRQTHRNDISFRIRTPATNGPVFYTEADNAPDDYITATLENGLLKVVFAADGFRSPRIVNVPRISDNRWHQVRIARRGKDTWLIIDGIEVRPESIPGEDGFYIDIDRVVVAGPKDSSGEGFVGQLQGFSIHPEGAGHLPQWDVFDMGTGKQLVVPPTSIHIEGNPRPPAEFVLYPISLMTPTAYVDIQDRLRDGSLYAFSFRTREQNGLVAAVDLPNMATALPRVELINGRLHLGVGTQTRAIPLPVDLASIADDHWHQVTLTFNAVASSSSLNVAASVDDSEAVSLQYVARTLSNLNFQSTLYLGGVPPDVGQRFSAGTEIKLQPGISGCFATLFANGRLINLWQHLAQLGEQAQKRGLSQGCSTGAACQRDSCKNGGICKPLGLTFICDCSGTGREGPTCADEPAFGYNFTTYPVGGLLVFPLQTSTFDFSLHPQSTDRLALGFMTYHPNGVILRVTSSRPGEPQPIYIELRMKDGRPVADVVIGGKLVTLAGSVKDLPVFNDGQYHGLMLVRDGKTLNLSADGLYAIASYVLPHESAQALSAALRHPPLYVTVGARPPHGVDAHSVANAWPDDYWTHPFTGIVAGLYINGARPFANGDISGTGHGNVKVAPAPFWIPQPASIEDLDAVIWDNGVAILTSQHAGGGGAGVELGTAVAVAPIIAPVLTPAAIAGIIAAGVILGLLLLLSALLWAFYRCKPGWCPCFSSPSSAKVLTVTAPKPIANYQLVQAAFARGVIETEVLLRTDNEAQTAPLVQPPPAFGAYSAFTSTSHKREMTRETEQFLPPPVVPAGYGTIASQFSGMPQYLSDEVRVDCFLFTSDGRYVVTGSSTGPPQVWDMQTGELLRTVSGLDTGSGDLHLCCDETMLAGNMGLGANPPADIPPAYRKFELWDFASGRQLHTEPAVYYTASALLKNACDSSDQLLLARTSSEGTAAVIWDVARNQQVKDMRTSWTVGDADSLVSALATPDNRYAVLGFLSPFTGNAHYLSFDLSRTFIEANSLEFDAYPECTVIISNVEAATGTRKGEIIIWDVQLARALRQLYQTADPTATSGPPIGGASFAHLSAVNSLAISSSDLRYLVSASSDCTLKIWDLATETCEHTLTGHTDEVWCTALASNEQLDLVASGSSDHTIRLWRRSTGKQLCWFNTHTDVFSIKVSPDGRTVAALGDKFGTRKLILLQMVKHRQRKQGASSGGVSRPSERV